MVMFNNRLQKFDNLRILILEGADYKWRVQWMSWGNDYKEEFSSDDYCIITFRVLDAKQQAIEFGRAVAKYEKGELEIISRNKRRHLDLSTKVIEDYREKA